MRGCLILYACAVLLPASALAEPIDLRPGGWEVTSALPGDPASPPDRQCMAAQDLQDLRILKIDAEDAESCTMQQIAQSTTHLEALQVCTGDDARQVRFIINAPTPTAFNGTISLVGGTAEQTINLTGKWIQASCEGFDD